MEKPIKTMTEAEYIDLRESYRGICLACGELRDCTEPDAEEYPCEVCDALAVQGIENALMAGNVMIVED